MTMHSAAGVDARARTFLWISLMSGVLILTRIPGLWISSPSSLLIDSELEMTFAALGQFLGIPSIVMIWPAGPLHMAAVPVFAADMILTTGVVPTPADATEYLARTFRRPWHALLVMRLIVVTISSIGLAACVVAFSEMLRSRLAGVFAAGALATIPALWLHSHMAVPDSMAVAFGCASFVPLLLSRTVRPRDVLISGLLAGLAMASKVTMLPVLCFVAGLMLDRVQGWRVRALVMLAAALAAGFVIGCPFVWTDPTTLLKTMIGNTVRGGIPMGLSQAGVLWVDVVTPWLAVMAAAGMVTTFARHRYWTAAGGAGAILLGIVIVGNAGVAFPRYFLPVAAVTATLAVFGAGEIAGYLERLQVKRAGAAAAVLAIVCALNAVVYARQVPAHIDEFRNLNLITEHLRTLGPRVRVVVPFENLFYYVAADATSESLERVRSTCASALVRVDALSTYGAASILGAREVSALPWIFNAQEQTCAASTALMAYLDNPNGMDVQVWAKPELANRFGFLTLQQAIALMQAGSADAVVANVPVEGANATRTWHGWSLLTPQ